MSQTFTRELMILVSPWSDLHGWLGIQCQVMTTDTGLLKTRPPPQLLLGAHDQWLGAEQNQICGPTGTSSVKRQILAWFGHVMRQGNLSKTNLHGNLASEQYCGQQGKCWMGNVKDWTSPAQARTAQNGLAEKKNGRRFLLNCPSCPPSDPIGQRTELNRTDPPLRNSVLHYPQVYGNIVPKLQTFHWKRPGEWRVTLPSLSRRLASAERWAEAAMSSCCVINRPRSIAGRRILWHTSNCTQSNSEKLVRDWVQASSWTEQ